MEVFFVVTLLTLLIFQQVYYTMIINRLVNKLMSRDFYEYKQAERGPLPKEKKEPKQEVMLDHNTLVSIGPQL